MSRACGVSPAPPYVRRLAPTPVTRVALLYPRSWAVELNPRARQMERKAELWLRERGVIRDAAGMDKFTKLAVGEYANWPFSAARGKRAEIITKFLSLWIFYDDVLEEADDGRQEAIFQAIGGRSKKVDGGDSHLQCWQELGQSCGKWMSRSWLDRHAQRFLEWVASVREESAAAQEFRASGLYPSAAKHLERRCKNIGMLPNIDFLELQMDWELPPGLLEDPDFRRLEELSAGVVALVNDIFGFRKDQGSRWCNLIPCLVQEFHISTEEACRWAADMHNARVRDIAALGAKLLARSTEENFARWIKGLHHIMYGFARWHAMAPRYSSRHEVDAGRQVLIEISTQ